MVFSSLYFLFLYLPIVLLVYYITPLKWRNAWLLVVNLVFYGWGEPKYIVLMLFTILLLVIIVCLIQFIFGFTANRIDKRNRS